MPRLAKAGVWALSVIFCAFILSLITQSSLASAVNPRIAVLLDIKGGIGPATQDFVVRGLAEAAKKEAQIVILRLDTPGGLSKSMRGINKAILSSPVPVVSYVAPSGARAASAGTYIMYASQIAAMAPGTNLGAATPVSIGTPGLTPGKKPAIKKDDKKTAKKKSTKTATQKKSINDAVAYIRSLAELHGRNVEWAEQAVREGVSLSANKALQMNVINLVANNTTDLLNQINGKTVTVLGQKRVLNTRGLKIVQITPDWRAKFLAVITDPSIAYILLLVGIYGIFFEFANPGFVLPGVVGVICILLALYAFQLLPINYVGLGLILFGIAFMVSEAFMPSFGALGMGGIVAFVVCSILLLDKGSGYAIGLPLIIAVSAVTAGFFLLIINMALRARFRPVVSGREELVGSEGVVIEDEKGRYRIRIRGELWQVKSSQSLQRGQKVKVIGREGLILIVNLK